VQGSTIGQEARQESKEAPTARRPGGQEARRPGRKVWKPGKDAISGSAERSDTHI